MAMNYESLNEEEKQQIQYKQLAVIKKQASDRSEKDVQLLIQTTDHIQFFKNYNKDPSFKGIHKQCCISMEYEYVKKGDWVFEIDTIGKKFYLILGGSVSIWIYPPDQVVKQKENLIKVKTLRQGEGFGELALMSKKPRLASIKADEDCHFAVLEKEPFKNILLNAENEKLLKEMGFFAELPLFQTWNFNLIKQIYLNSIKKSYKRGDKVFNQGDKPDKIFIVSSGQYTIFKEIHIDCLEDEKYMMRPQDEQFNQLEGKNLKAGRPPQKKLHQITTLAGHELFGEEDILNKQQIRSFSVICQEEGVLLEISKNDLLLRILTQHCSERYLKERLSIKENLMKERLEFISNQLKITTYNQYEDQFYKMRMSSPLKQSIREKLFNNEILLNKTGIIPRKFSQEELKKYNKKFDDELQKRRQEEEKKPEFLNTSTKLFIHKLQFHFKNKLGSEERLTNLQDHIKSSSVIGLIPNNLASAPTLKELREEYEDELPKVVNKATLNYFLKKINKMRQKSKNQLENNSLNYIPSLNDIPQSTNRNKKANRKNKTYQHLYKSSLDESTLRLVEENILHSNRSIKSPIIPSLNHLQIPQEPVYLSLSKENSRERQRSEGDLFITNEKSEEKKSDEIIKMQKKENEQQQQQQSSHTYISPQKLTYSTKHQNLVKLFEETKKQASFCKSHHSFKQMRKQSNQSDNYNDKIHIDTNKYFNQITPIKSRNIKSSYQLSRIQTSEPLNKTSFLELRNQPKQQSSKYIKSTQINSSLFYTTSYKTPSAVQFNQHSPLFISKQINKTPKTMAELQQVIPIEQNQNQIDSTQTCSPQPQLVSFLEQKISKSITYKQPISSQLKQDTKPINFLITNFSKNIQRPQTNDSAKKKRIIYI